MTERTTPVAIVGEWSLEAGHLARLLLAADIAVVFFDLMNPDAIDEDHPSVASAGEFPGLTFFSERDGDDLQSCFRGSETACSWALGEIRRKFGAPGDIVIADWSATISNANGRQMLGALASAGDARLFAIEGPAISSDQVTRWMTRWHGQVGSLVEMRVLRAPSYAAPDHELLHGAASWEAAASKAGYVPVTIEEVDFHAATSRSSGDDALAGRLWEEAGGTDIEAGIAAFAGIRLRHKWPLPGEEDPPDTWNLQTVGIPAVLSRFTNEMCGIDTSPPDEVPDAVRIVLDSDTFEKDGSWHHLADLDLPEGTVFVGGWDSLRHGKSREVRPGRYAVERWHGESEAFRIRLLKE